MAGLDDGAQKGRDTLSKKVSFIEQDATDAPVKDINWGVQQLEAHADPINDPGLGQGVVVRNFFFKSPPRQQGQTRPSKQDIIAGHKHIMGTMLWADGLVPLEDKAVRLYSKKEVKSGMLKAKMLKEGADFVIMVLASPRSGVALAEKPQLLT